MTDVPDDVRRMARERDEARRRRDFERADSLRTEIEAAGFEVTDSPEESVLTPLRMEEEATFGRSDDVPSLLDSAPTFDASIHWLTERWPQDVARGVESIDRSSGSWRIQQVVVVADDPRGIPSGVDQVRVAPSLGWAAARNAGLRRSAGEVVVIADGSVEAQGDVVGPLVETLRDPAVGITGPFGVVSDDLREFRDGDGPDVDAVEAYVLAFRRELLIQGLRFDEKFSFYRSADLDLSFQVKALGLRAVVTPVPVHRHVHRTWTSTPEDRRTSLSKRNFYRFLDRWRSRSDLLESNRGKR